MNFKVGDVVKLSEKAIKYFSRDNWTKYYVPYTMSQGDYGTVVQLRGSGDKTEIYVKNNAGEVFYYEDDLEFVIQNEETRNVIKDIENGENLTHYSTVDELFEELKLVPPLGGLTGTQSAVHSPKHYAVFDGIEAIEIIAGSMTKEMFRGYCFGNMLKYRLRCGKKDNVEQELSKADKYQELFDKYKHLCKE